MNEIELQSRTIDWLRFPLSVLVIFIHMNPIVDIHSVDYLNLNLYSLYDIVGTLISEVLGQIAVPCFFMFSGYWFFYQIKEWNRTVYFTKIRTRLRTLVVPYLLFNISAIIIYALLKILNSDGSIYPYLDELIDNWYRIFWNNTFWNSDSSNMIGLPMQPNFGPFVLPLWFLRDLIVMVFISPIVYYWVKLTKLWGIFILFFFYYTKIWFEIPGYSARLFLTAIFFFSIGSFFSLNKKNLVISLRKHQIGWFIIALITMLLNIYLKNTVYEQFFSPIFVLSGVISVVNVSSYFIERKKLQVREILSKSSFFIYCTHSILILYYTRRIIQFISFKILGIDNIVAIFVTYIMTPFICAGIILCIYLMMRRFTPSFLSLYTGNR